MQEKGDRQEVGLIFYMEMDSNPWMFQISIYIQVFSKLTTNQNKCYFFMNMHLQGNTKLSQKTCLLISQ